MSETSGGRGRAIRRFATLFAVAAMLVLSTGVAGAARRGSSGLGPLRASAPTLSGPACAYFRQGDLQCYASATEMATAIAAYDPAVAPDTGCGSSPWLYLYQTPYFGGQVLALDNVGSWVDLKALGFGDEMSSWINTSSCVAYASKGTDGSTPLLTMGANNSSVEVPSGWIDAANSAEIY